MTEDESSDSSLITSNPATQSPEKPLSAPPMSDLPNLTVNNNNSIGRESLMVLQVPEEKTSSINPNGNGEVKQSPAGTEVSITNTPAPTCSPESNVTKESSKQLHSIDPNSGICSSCNDSDALKTSLECMFCSVNFHAVCRNVDTDKTGADIICARTFYKGYVQAVSKEGIYTRRFGTFAFVCNNCKTQSEIDRAATQTNKIDKMDRRIDNLANNISEIKSMLLAASGATPKTIPGNIDEKFNRIDKRADDLANSMNSIMEILKKPPTKPDISNPGLDAGAPTKRLYSSTVSGPERSVLVVEKGSDVKAVETVIVDNFIHVDQTSVNKSDGASVYVCKSKKDRNDLQEKLLQKYPEIKTRKPAELLPTISIAYLKYSMTEGELKTALTLREPGLKKLVDAGEMFNVNKVKPHKKNDSFYQATIRVSTEIRKFIAFELNNRLYLGANSYPVFDRFHVKRCDKCHRFNHYEEACTADKVTCGHCSGNHVSGKCPHTRERGFYPCCNNCKHSTKNKETQHSHNAFSLNCPSYIDEQNKLRGNIHYYSQVPKNM